MLHVQSTLSSSKRGPEIVLALMDQISVVRPPKRCFLATETSRRASVEARCCYSMRRLEQQENNDSAFKPQPPDSSQGDIVKRAAGDSGSSDINSQTLRNAERSSVAYFPEAAAARPFDPLQLLEEEDVRGGVWGWEGGSSVEDSWKRLICSSGVVF